MKYIPRKGVINPNIVGYEFVKDVVAAGGFERTACDLLFVYRRPTDGGCLDHLANLCEVRKNTRADYDALRAMYPFETHIVEFGCVRTLPEGAAVLPSGGDVIELYWS